MPARIYPVLRRRASAAVLGGDEEVRVAVSPTGVVVAGGGCGGRRDAVGRLDWDRGPPARSSTVRFTRPI